MATIYNEAEYVAAANAVEKYALTTNPTIYDSLVKQFWQTATANTLADGTLELHATIDTIVYTITEASIRNKLQLADASGITMLPNNEIFEGMGHMGYPTDGSFTFWKSFFTPQWRFLVHHILHCISSKSGGWDQFGSNIATALICLSTGRVYNFSKLIFDGMVANLKSKTKFLMYPRFLQLILDIQTENKHPYLAVTLTKKIFGNMKRGFRGAPRPLLPAMLLVATTNPSAGQEHPDVAQSQPSSSTIPVPSTSFMAQLSLNDWLRIRFGEGTDEDDDDLEGITDYLKPTLYNGFIDSDDEEYKERKYGLMGMPYIKPPPILIEKVKVTRHRVGPGEV
ncbi:hypothetical protein Tco_1465900 [Tanacetum coccineum]